MSHPVTEQVGSLLWKLSKRLNRKVSEIVLLLFNHKNAGSFGALAGFAIAIVFTWKFLRSSPGRPRRNIQKRRNAPSTTTGGSAANEGASSSESDAFELPIQLNAGQIVRRKLNGCRKMTCQLLGVILEERSSEELQMKATIRLSVVEVLLAITKSCDLYLMERVLDDESEERVLTALEGAGLFHSGGLTKDKVLFCSTESGRSSFVRQLEADWHIDTNLEVVSQLSRFIKNQLHVTPADVGQIAPNVFTSTSLEQYFACL